MTRVVADFMTTPCMTVEALAGLRQVRKFFFNNNQECFPVVDGKQVVGILTWQDFIEAHPNRIVADAMSQRFAYAESNMSVWEASEMLTHDHLAALIVQQEGKLAGLVTPVAIKTEMGRHTDLLTGLYKNDYLYYQALKLMTSGQEVSIVFIDVNNFGLINKQFGHINGDTLLKELSEILKANIPADACLCRFGGDEFIVLLPASRDEAAMFSYQLERTIASHIFMNNIPVTIAAGVVTGDRNSDPALEPHKVLASLINRASLASTTAKKDNSGIKKQVENSESA